MARAASPYPVVSGQDAELPSVKSILAGEQSSTVFKDTRELAKVTATMVDTILSGGKPEINDEKTYNNGVKVVSVLPSEAGGRRQVELGKRSWSAAAITPRNRSPTDE